MPRRTTLVIAALAAVVAVAFAAWFSRAPLVPAVSVHAAPLVRTLQFSARVATLSRVDLGSTLTGRVVRVAVLEGTRVKQGELLIVLESDELRAALAQAQAGEQQAAARLAGLRSSGRSGATAAVAQADSVLVAARAELQRTQDLVSQGFLSPARLDEVRRTVEVAQAQQASARALQAANAEQGADVAQAQAQLAVASATTAAAQARLAQTVITAPTDGTVLTRDVEPGQIVQPGKTLLSLALAGPVQLVAPVDERFLEQLKVGQTASVMADAFPAQRFGAVVQSIAPVVDAQRGAIEVKFSLAQQPAPAFLREDMTLSVEVETARRERTLVVPVAALRNDGSATDSVVWVDNEGRVQERKLRLGLRTLDAAEVLEGLVEGELVLIGAAPPPGQRVRAELAAPSTASAPAAASAGARKGAREDAGSALTNAMGR